MSEFSHPVLLGLVAGVLQLVGYILYVRLNQTVNAGSWLVWTIGASVEAMSYFHMTHGEMAKNALPFACAIGCCIAFMVMWCSGRFGWPDAFDWFIVFIDCGIAYIWFTNMVDATSANLLFQVGTFISFLPLIRGQVNSTEDAEHPLPWFVWTMGYGSLAAVVWLMAGKVEELVYPTLNFFLHGVVLAIAVRKELSSTA